MFRTLAKRLHDVPPYLGMGLYYFRPGGEWCVEAGDWAKVELKAPLVLNGKQVGMLIQKYKTDSIDRVTAMAGAWALRREVLNMGRDGIVADNGIMPVGAKLSQGGATIVDLVGGWVQIEGARGEARHSAQIFSLGQGGLLIPSGK